MYKQAQAKKKKAEKELAKIRESWLPVGPPDDLETITDEERVMFRRVGLRMKPYLPLGGFDISLYILYMLFLVLN